MNTTTRLSATVIAFALGIGSLFASDWPGFRGSRGGVADDKDLPAQWTGDNVLWKIKLPGAGTSSPITTGDKIFVTVNAGYGTAITKGKTGFGKGGGGMFGPYTASTPVAKDGVVYVIGGGGPSPAQSLAVKTGGSGDVTKTHIVWKQKAVATNCSPVLSGNYLCWVDGTVTCLNTADGTVAYKERLYDAKGEYVSAVAAGDKIFGLTRYSGLFVIAGGGKFEKLGQFDFKGDTSIFNASPAISDGRIFIRSNEYLYCVGKK